MSNYLEPGKEPTNPWKAILTTTKGPVQVIVVSREEWGHLRVLLSDNRELRVARDSVRPQYKSQFTASFESFHDLMRNCRLAYAKLIVQAIQNQNGKIDCRDGKLFYTKPPFATENLFPEIARLEKEIIEVLKTEESKRI